MATTILKVNNSSADPVAYVGHGGIGVPTGWSAWAFPASSVDDFGWEVTQEEHAQALLTKAGTFYIWDDRNWNIKCQAPGRPATVLTHVDARFPFPINIEVDIDGNGYPSARQL